MPNIGFPELILIFLILIFLFGASRIGDLGSALGKGIKGFKKSMKDEDIDVTPEKENSKPIEGGEFQSGYSSSEKKEKV